MMQDNFFTVVATVIGAVFFLTLIFKGFRIVKQSECMIVERLGKFDRVLSSGFKWTIPVMDSIRPVYWVRSSHIIYSTRIDLRETMLDIPEQMVITRDNVSISIDALLYIQITDPIKAAYEISNLPMSVAQLAQTSLRNVIGEMELDESLTSRDTINTKLKAILDEATDKWGTKVNRVEIRNITPPRDIQDAMEKQMQAERERRAKILEAEGDRAARVARSEGIKVEEINLAEGNKQARIKNAEGEAEAIRSVAAAQEEAINKVKSSLGNSTELTAQYLVAKNYIDAFSGFVTQPGDKIYIPYEATTAIASLGGIKDMLEGKFGQKTNGSGRPAVRPAAR